MSGKDDFALTIMVGDAGRWAKDAPRARDAPLDLTFSTSSQGGFVSMETSLLRSLDDTGTEALFDRVQVLAQGGGYVAWDGRLQRTPRSVNRRYTVNPQAQGWTALLEDRQDARALFIDRDLSGWGSGTVARQQGIIGVPVRPHAPISDSYRLRLSIPGYAFSAASGKPYCEATYDAGPLRWATVGGTWRSTTSGGANMGPPWVLAAFGADDADVTAGVVAGPSFMTAAPAPTTATTWSYTPSAAKRLAGVQFYYPNFPGGTSQENWEISLESLYVVGNHGLDLQGSGPSDYGILASDAIGWLVRTFAPALKQDIQATTISLPHLAFREPQSPRSILQQINAFQGGTWGVWEDQTFKYRQWDSGSADQRVWYVRASDAGVELTQEGDDASALWSDIVVQYTTPTGETRTVGPTWTATCDDYNDALSITDTSHPCVKAGQRRVYLHQMDVPWTRDAAVAVGAVILDQLNQAARAGTASIRGYVRDGQGLEYPAYMVRGGDWLVIDGIGNETPRRILETTYTHAQRQVACTLDNRFMRSDILLALAAQRSVGRL